MSSLASNFSVRSVPYNVRSPTPSFSLCIYTSTTHHSFRYSSSLSSLLLSLRLGPSRVLSAVGPLYIYLTPFLDVRKTSLPVGLSSVTVGLSFLLLRPPRPRSRPFPSQPRLQSQTTHSRSRTFDATSDAETTVHDPTLVQNFSYGDRRHDSCLLSFVSPSPPVRSVTSPAVTALTVPSTFPVPNPKPKVPSRVS